MDDILRSEINAMITKRILAFRAILIATGKLKMLHLRGLSLPPLFLVAAGRRIHKRRIVF
jgi:hypothetical protein